MIESSERNQKMAPNMASSSPSPGYLSLTPDQWFLMSTDQLPRTAVIPLVNEPSGKKNDQDKSRVDLLDPEFLVAVGEVLRFGANKYAAHNWRGGIAISRLIGSTFRHLLAICRGEDTDSESGLPHTAHLGCNAMFLYAMLKHRPDLDDRWKYQDHGWE